MEVAADTKVLTVLEEDPKNQWIQRAETVLGSRDFKTSRSWQSGFVYRAVRIKKDEYIRLRVHYFATHNQPGKLIRHAVSGVNYNARVGSTDESFFYSVLLATGESNIHGQPILLFYDNPEEYEKHMHVRLPAKMKEEWHARFDRFIRGKNNGEKSGGNNNASQQWQNAMTTQQPLLSVA